MQRGVLQVGGDEDEEFSAQGQGFTGGEAGSGSGKVKTRTLHAQSAPAVGTCQVQGCGASLAPLREYYQRYRICETHLKMAQLPGPDGELQRFCQLCGRFHHLSAFDDTKRSCRERLVRHNDRRKRRVAREVALANAARGGSRPRSQVVPDALGNDGDSPVVSSDLLDSWGTGGAPDPYPHDDPARHLHSREDMYMQDLQMADRPDALPAPQLGCGLQAGSSGAIGFLEASRQPAFPSSAPGPQVAWLKDTHQQQQQLLGLAEQRHELANAQLHHLVRPLQPPPPRPMDAPLGSCLPTFLQQHFQRHASAPAAMLSNAPAFHGQPPFAAGQALFTGTSSIDAPMRRPLSWPLAAPAQAGQPPQVPDHIADLQATTPMAVDMPEQAGEVRFRGGCQEALGAVERAWGGGEGRGRHQASSATQLWAPRSNDTSATLLHMLNPRQHGSAEPLHSGGQLHLQPPLSAGLLSLAPGMADLETAQLLRCVQMGDVSEARQIRVLGENQTLETLWENIQQGPQSRGGSVDTVGEAIDNLFSGASTSVSPAKRTQVAKREQAGETAGPVSCTALNVGNHESAAATTNAQASRSFTSLG